MKTRNVYFLIILLQMITMGIMLYFLIQINNQNKTLQEKIETKEVDYTKYINNVRNGKLYESYKAINGFFYKIDNLYKNFNSYGYTEPTDIELLESVLNATLKYIDERKTLLGERESMALNNELDFFTTLLKDVKLRNKAILNFGDQAIYFSHTEPDNKDIIWYFKKSNNQDIIPKKYSTKLKKWVDVSKYYFAELIGSDQNIQDCTKDNVGLIGVDNSGVDVAICDNFGIWTLIKK